MATGEKMFSSSALNVAPAFVSKPLTPGEYDAKLNNDWEPKVAEGEGKLPYLNGSFEIMGTAQKEGGKNRRVYHKFFLDTQPTAKGWIGVSTPNGIVAFSKCADTQFDVAGLTKMRTNKESGELEPTVILAPKALTAWLKAQEGTVVRVRIKTEKNDRGERSVVDSFVFTADESADSEAGAGSSGAEEQSSMEEDEEEEEVAPARKPAAKAAPKNGHSKGNGKAKR